MIELSTPVEELSRVGKTTSSRLHRLGITRARDLLFHFPNRYEDWTHAVSIDQVRPNQNISIEGEVASIKNFRSPRKRLKITEAILKDSTGSLKIIWFNQPFLTQTLPIGTKVSLSGKSEISGKEIILKSPKYEVIGSDMKKIFTDRILPVYPLAMNITQKQIQFLVDLVLPFAKDLEDPLPESIREELSIPHLSTAIRWIHQPESMEQVELAQKRFAFEEVFYLQLQSAHLRELNEQHFAEPIVFQEEKIKQFVETLPFELTNDQKKTAYKIFLDLKEEKPMNRLVQGDVGSGKTVVAAMAMYNASLSDFQSALMAPTEVLALQHFQNLSKLFSGLGLPVAILTRTQYAVAVNGEVTYKSKRKIIEAIAGDEIKLIIGTHALLQNDVNFSKLGLAVIDEQHRFGVDQRKKLREQSGDQLSTPHLLSMTATPIPRTLSLVFYGDLSISSIREMPKDRLPIQTKVVTEAKRQQAYTFIQKEIEQGSQVYVVCPLIEESDKLGVTSVTEELKKLTKVFPKVRIQALHGKLKSNEKETIMTAFKEHEIDLLVATTVIEVGVDVANATIMVIEGAERFGLSQLHQIRGRVGRGSKQSYCYLFPTDQTASAVGRLQRFVQCKDGFQVAELDLQIRGSGELLGTRQSGAVELRFADIADINFIEKVNQIVEHFMQSSSLDDFPLLKQHIEERNKNIHLE